MTGYPVRQRLDYSVNDPVRLGVAGQQRRLTPATLALTPVVLAPTSVVLAPTPAGLQMNNAR